MDVDWEDDHEREEGEDAEKENDVALERQVDHRVRTAATPDRVVTDNTHISHITPS